MVDSHQHAQAEHAGSFKVDVGCGLSPPLEGCLPTLRSLRRSSTADDSAELGCASCHTLKCSILPSGIFLNSLGAAQMVWKLRALRFKIWFTDLVATQPVPWGKLRTVTLAQPSGLPRVYLRMPQSPDIFATMTCDQYAGQ